MNLTWRELCRELINSRGADYYRTLERARKALADEPAVHKGREPAAVVSEPSDEELLEKRPSLEEVEELCEEHCFNVEGYESLECLQGLINDALARWGTPNQAEIRSSLGAAPAPPDEGEVGELVAWLRQRWPHLAHIPNSDYAMGVRVADLLEQRQAAPVPVSEHLPGPDDCDGDDFCWWFSPADPSAGTFGVASCWVLRKHEPEDDFRTHWLPATALPLPQGEMQ